MDNRTLPTSKFGFVEKNPSSFQMWYWVKCFFNFDIWVWGRQIFPTRKCWFWRDEMLSALKFGFGGILLGNVGVVQETNISNFVICVLRTTTNLSTFAPLGSAGTPLPSNFHDLELCFGLFLRSRVFQRDFNVISRGALSASLPPTMVDHPISPPEPSPP